MSSAQLSGLIGFVGILIQAAGSAWLLLLFVLLHRRARRGYFARWTAAWAAVACALAAVAASYQWIGFQPDGTRGAAELVVRALFAVYQGGKLLALLFFVIGAAEYARHRVPAMVWRALAAALVLLALASAVATVDLSRYVIVQAPVAVAAYVIAGALLLALPRAERSFGSVATGLTFLMGAALWSVYGVAFHAVVTPAWSSLWRARLSVVVQYNPYLDFVLCTFLGFGMVLLLMEEAKREVEEAKHEVDEAHASLALAHERLRRMAMFDPLTGCLNRQGFREQRSAGLAAGTIVVVDMDNLKTVNDRHGHAAGDEMLRHLARVLQEALPPGAGLYRWGGDEFLAVMPGVEPADGHACFTRAVRAAKAVVLPGVPSPCALEASVGAAAYQTSAELEAAIRHADRGMYAQKHTRKLRSGSYPVTLG